MAERKHYAILNMQDNKITELATCTASTDAANKAYVDSQVSAETMQSHEWEFDDSQQTEGDAGSGKFFMNHASDLASVTKFWLDDEDADGNNRSAYIVATDEALRIGSGLIVYKSGATTVGAFYTITGIVDDVGYVEITVSYIGPVGAGGTTLADEDTIVFCFANPKDGSKITSLPSPALDDVFQVLDASDSDTPKITQVANACKAANDNQVAYEFDTVNTSDSDPGAGKFKINNADFALASEVYISDADYDGIDRSAFLNANRSGTGLILRENTNAGEWALYTIKRVEDKTDYIKLYVTYIDGSESFANTNIITFTFEPAKQFSDFTAITAPANDDYLILEDTSEGKEKKKLAFLDAYGPFGQSFVFQFDSTVGAPADT